MTCRCCPASSVRPGAGAARAAAAGGGGGVGGRFGPAAGWADKLCRPAGLSSLENGVWGEVRALVRVTRIDQPEAVLVAPEQAFFLRENLKLRLLNARLALLSRQFDIAQSDLRDAQSALERYFDRGSRRVVRRSNWCARWRRRPAWSACRGRTPRWRPLRPPRLGR
jgi:uroporphyrin-3 C-methyltransferase